eukprot:1196073-Prorocentrum_minimum.AAC.6
MISEVWLESFYAGQPTWNSYGNFAGERKACCGELQAKRVGDCNQHSGIMVCAEEGWLAARAVHKVKVPGNPVHPKTRHTNVYHKCTSEVAIASKVSMPTGEKPKSLRLFYIEHTVYLKFTKKLSFVLPLYQIACSTLKP